MTESGPPQTTPGAKPKRQPTPASTVLADAAEADRWIDPTVVKSLRMQGLSDAQIAYFLGGVTHEHP